MSNPPIVPQPPDLQPDLSQPNPVELGPEASPAAPPKETFGQGFARGAAGEPYVVDAQGNVVSARMTSPSRKGTFGSILAGAVMGALAGASAARPGGIPSHELGGGPGQGAAAANKYFRERDLLRRSQAQQNFQNQQVAKEQQNKDLMYKAQIHMAGLNAIKLQHDIDVAQREDPVKYQQLLNASKVAAMQVDEAAKSLGLTNERVYKDYSDVPQADIDKFNRHQVFLLQSPDGVHVWDRTFDPRTTPNSQDFEIKDLMGFDAKTGKPEWKTVGHVKAGSGTAAQQEAELQKENTQLMDFAVKNATIESEKAKAGLEREQTALTAEELKSFRQLGVNLPTTFKTPPNAFQLSQPDLVAALQSQGVTPPQNFASIYGMGHYKVDPNTFPARTYNRPGQPPQLSKAQAIDMVRTFVNPNYDEHNYKAVQQLENEFASTKQGSAGGNLISFNTAVGHLGQLYDAAQDLQNGNVQALNDIAVRVSAQVGQPVAPNFNAIRDVLVGELARLMKQAAPDVEEMKQIRSALDNANSPQQFAGVTRQFAHAMLTKGMEQVNHYYAYTGELPPGTFSPQAQAVFQKLGININDVLPIGAITPEGQVGNKAPNANNPPPVPPGVAALLTNQKPGIYKLNDGSSWTKGADGKISRSQ